jgi:hypothetical protein
MTQHQDHDQRHGPDARADGRDQPVVAFQGWRNLTIRLGHTPQASEAWQVAARIGRGYRAVWHR